MESFMFLCSWIIMGLKYKKVQSCSTPTISRLVLRSLLFQHFCIWYSWAPWQFLVAAPFVYNWGLPGYQIAGFWGTTHWMVLDMAMMHCTIGGFLALHWVASRSWWCIGWIRICHLLNSPLFTWNYYMHSTRFANNSKTWYQVVQSLCIYTTMMYIISFPWIPTVSKSLRKRVTLGWRWLFRIYLI